MNIGLIYGAPAQTAQLAREDVLKELAKEMPDRVKIVAEGYGNWLTETAQNLTTDWLQAHSEINYISAANDIMALGAANALASAGATSDVMVSGYDLTDDGITRIQKGSQALNVGVSLEDQGSQVIDVALGLVDGTFVDKTYYVNPVYSVTADNVEDYLEGTLSK
jgi:ABC-type sugar transport system substrate-binding protein